MLAAIALHSFVTGLGLLWQPDVLISWAGWRPVGESFFPAQGGVFHVLMAALYGKAALHRESRAVLCRLIVFIKTVAAVFLLSWHFLAAPVWIVLLSGVGDGVMAIAVAWLSAAERSAEARTTERSR